jgi:hypothetical protein
MKERVDDGLGMNRYPISHKEGWGFFVSSLWERTKSGRVHVVRLGKYSMAYEDATPEVPEM